MKDIRRTYEYHGAEHKTIACYEAGEELTVENVKSTLVSTLAAEPVLFSSP